MKEVVRELLTSQFRPEPKGPRSSATAVPDSTGPLPNPAPAVDCRVDEEPPVPTRQSVLNQTSELLGKSAKKRKSVSFNLQESASVAPALNPSEATPEADCFVTPSHNPSASEPIAPTAPSVPSEPPSQQAASAPSAPSVPICANSWPANYLDEIKRIVSTPSQEMSKPDISFELTREAALKNFLVMKKHKLDMKELIESQSSTPMYYGSEFRQTSVLEPLLVLHPNWTHLKSILENGSDWHLEELDEEKRMSDLLEALEFGNHKGASEQPDLLRKLLLKDVLYGYCFTVPMEKLTSIPGICVAPMNIQAQSSINELGEIVPKERLTHDQSYKWGSETSVNSRTKEEDLQPCLFGHALRRFINKVVAMRLKYPNNRILCSKIDFKAAFRRMHLAWRTALRSCTLLPDDELALIFIRLTFGGKACPSEWGTLSELVCDLTNAIITDEEWDPKSLFCQQSLELPAPEFLDDDIPIAKARELAFDIPVDSKGYADVFIDDLFVANVDLPESNNIKRLERAPLLAIDAVARPLLDSEPIPRHEMAARNKFIAEAGGEELKIVLGWLINFRTLMMHLPQNKFIAWAADFQQMIDSKRADTKKLESCIGRMIHVSQILPEVNHFLSRLRDLRTRAGNRRSIAVREDCLADCRLMIKFIEKSSKGLSMNNLVFRLPNRVYRSDSCPHGLGGYSDQGFAWRLYLPSELLFRASNNLLEHIASIITVWIDILAGRLSPEDCVLSMTDSSTSEGWAHKTNFSMLPEEVDCQVDPVEASSRIAVARKFAELCMDANICHYSQWFPGKENDVSDALSRDNDRSDEELTNILYSHVPEQMPQHFEIVPLPTEIVSWLTSLLSNLPVKTQLQERHTRTKLGRGRDGLSTQDQSESHKTSSSTVLPSPKESKSWEPLPWLCAKGDFQAELMIPWLKRQSAIPSHLYHRPSGRTNVPTPQETMMDSLEGFYRGYSEPLRTKIQRKNNRKLSQQQC